MHVLKKDIGRRPPLVLASTVLVRTNPKYHHVRKFKDRLGTHCPKTGCYPSVENGTRYATQRCPRAAAASIFHTTRKRPTHLVNPHAAFKDKGHRRGVEARVEDAFEPSPLSSLKGMEQKANTTLSAKLRIVLVLYIM